MTVDTITPGVHHGLPEDVYHGHKGSLSFSGAKRLLPPSCPAIYKWERDNGRPPKDAYDLGHAVHTLTLGVGAPFHVIDADDWRSKAAREAKAEAHADGRTPLLRAQYDEAQAMADAVRAHPIAAALFAEGTGVAETSILWHDNRYDVTRRARPDWMTHPVDGHVIIGDLKSCVSAEPTAIAKSVANYRYDMQDQWYREAVLAAGIADTVTFLFVFVEKTAPYLVTVAELDRDAQRRGRLLNDRALEVYAECTATDTWPSYTSDVELISLPAWATYDLRGIA